MQRLLFRNVRVPVIIGSVRSNRVIAVVAILGAALAACSSGSDRRASPPSPSNLKPTRPGQVVIIGGNYRINQDPIDGADAVRTSAYSHGGLAVGSDGSVYAAVSYGYREGRIARITPVGRLHLMPFNSIANRLAVHGTTLWLMTSASTGIDLVQVSLTSNQKTPFFGWNSRFGKRPTVLNSSGKVVSRAERRTLENFWGDSSFGLRSDGTPLIVSNRGELFEALGAGKLRRWEPTGYASALRASRGGDNFGPTSVAEDGTGGIIVLGRQGLIKVPRSGPAKYVPFPKAAAELPPWNSALSLPDGSILLLGGVSATKPAPRPAIVRSDERFELLDWGGRKYCQDFDGTLAIVGSADIGGIGRRPDGSVVVNDLSCGQIYAFQLPNPMKGVPYS